MNNYQRCTSTAPIPAVVTVYTNNIYSTSQFLIPIIYLRVFSTGNKTSQVTLMNVYLAFSRIILSNLIYAHTFVTSTEGFLI